MKKKALEFVGWLSIATGGSIIFARRIAGGDLTEMQLLANDWQWFLAAALMIASGVACIFKSE